MKLIGICQQTKFGHTVCSSILYGIAFNPRYVANTIESGDLNAIFSLSPLSSRVFRPGFFRRVFSNADNSLIINFDQLRNFPFERRWQTLTTSGINTNINMVDSEDARAEFGHFGLLNQISWGPAY